MRGRAKVMLVAVPVLIAVAFAAGMGGPSSNPDEWKTGDRVTFSGMMIYQEWTRDGRVGEIDVGGDRVRFIYPSGDFLAAPGMGITVTGEVLESGVIRVEDARW